MVSPPPPPFPRLNRGRGFRDRAAVAAASAPPPEGRNRKQRAVPSSDDRVTLPANVCEREKERENCGPLSSNFGEVRGGGSEEKETLLPLAAGAVAPAAKAKAIYSGSKEKGGRRIS